MIYQILICLGNRCQCAINPATGVAHLRRNHKITGDIRNQVQRYINRCKFKDYTYATVGLPADGLAPQPVIPTVNGFHCINCTHRHNKRVPDDHIFKPVRLYSWFWKGKERYWVVEENQEPQQSLQCEVVTPPSQPVSSEEGS